MDFLSEKFALKSQPSKNSDFYMGAGGSLEHVMETLDNESFYSKTSGSKCVQQAFNPLQRAEHHVRLERTSPCQDNSGESSSRGFLPPGDVRGRARILMPGETKGGCAASAPGARGCQLLVQPR